jgi:signal transduction histidine kinase
MHDLQLADLIDEQVSFHKAAADEKNIEMTTEIEADLPVITADKQGLDEVLTNLLTNAVKYSPKDAGITVSAGVENGHAVIKVSDTGYGIPEEDLAEIFNRFHRVKDKNTREIHGTGLGLAIVKSIVDAHRGSISVESKIEQGTTFTVLLPLKSSE